jgi:hypothetical protein
MAKSQNKTTATDVDPAEFVAAVEHKTRREDAEQLLEFFARVTGMTAKMWGPTLIGYGQYHYKYDSGREGDMLITGFSPRKSNLVFYIMPGYQDCLTSLTVWANTSSVNHASTSTSSPISIWMCLKRSCGSVSTISAKTTKRLRISPSRAKSCVP